MGDPFPGPYRPNVAVVLRLPPERVETFLRLVRRHIEFDRSGRSTLIVTRVSGHRLWVIEEGTDIPPEVGEALRKSRRRGLPSSPEPVPPVAPSDRPATPPTTASVDREATT
jgi:hypothetical protein